MNVSRQVEESVLALIREHRIVVWYDADRVFHECFRRLAHVPLRKVDASGSVLVARRDADLAWRQLFDPDSLDPAPVPLLVYVPGDRGASEEARRHDPFEPFALAGATFGAVDAERLPSIARRVFAGREAVVDRLFAEGKPTVGQLDALAGGARYPLLQKALGTDIPIRVATTLLCASAEIESACCAAPGLQADLKRLLTDAFGFVQEVPGDVEGLVSAFARWALFSEFVFDLPGELPSRVAHVPRAAPAFRSAIYDLCHALRTSSEHRDAYRDHATEVEYRLGLRSLDDGSRDLGKRDTFPFEDRAALRRMQQAAVDGNVEVARSLVRERRSSVWRSLPERDQLWRLADRCLDLLERGTAWEARCVGASRPVADHVRAYCAQDDGMWRVDQAQRLVEQAAAMLVDRDSLAPLLEVARSKYRTWMGDAQAAFLQAVQRGGWPPEGFVRQAEAWSRHAAPAVRDGRRVAWFLVDALRYEMGRELGASLEGDGTLRVEAACGVVPAVTPFGMAALLPGAESNLTAGEQDGTLVPLLGGRPVVTSEHRREVFRAALGDRFRSIRLGDLLTSSTSRLREQVGTADVLAVFSTEIDDFGEHSDPLVARRYMGEVVADLLAASRRLAEVGFERMVFASDHGFIQLPEVLPGDRCQEPPGQWMLRKRRALVGTAGTRGDGVVTLDAASLGLHGPVSHVCVPQGVKVFRAGSPYFHEGLSLQECLVPLVVLDAVRRPVSDEEDGHVEVLYRNDRFTTRIFSVQVRFTSILQTSLPVRVRAFVPGTNEVAGEAADCESRDPHTGLVTLSSAQPVQVPITLEMDFEGDAVEVRVLDAITPGRAHASLVLRNATLD